MLSFRQKNLPKKNLIFTVVISRVFFPKTVIDSIKFSRVNTYNTFLGGILGFEFFFSLAFTICALSWFIFFLSSNY